MSYPQGYFFRRNGSFCEGKYWGISNLFGYDSMTEIGGSLSNFAYVILGVLIAFYSHK